MCEFLHITPSEYDDRVTPVDETFIIYALVERSRRQKAEAKQHSV
jgi:hypothetical protein